MTLLIAANPIITILVIAQTLAIAVLALLLIRRQRIERSTALALQGWYIKQSTLLEHQADTIRDSALQELFALRRSLELAELKPNQTEPKQYQLWVQQLEALYSSLNGLIETLSPPLTDGNLPLVALSHLKQVAAADKGFTISIESCANWTDNAVRTNQLLLARLQNLVDQALLYKAASSINLYLKQYLDIKQMNIQFRCFSQHSKNTYKARILSLCRLLKGLYGIDYAITEKQKEMQIQLQ